MRARIGAPHFELAEIARDHRDALMANHAVTREQKRVFTDITQCRTAKLGGHLELCTQCEAEHPSYNSCRNRHCPKCQASAQQRWIDNQRERLLDVPHFHVVFTLPAELRPLAAFARSTIFALLFQCVAQTLLAFGRRHLDATMGLTLVLHTWDKQLRFHPHIHCIVTAGGLQENGHWRSTDPRFLFSVQALSRVFRGKTIAALRRAYRLRQFDPFDEFQDPEGFEALISRIKKKSWYVYAKRSFGRARYVIEYLGRYTHRVAISNSRIVSYDGTRVVIRTRGSERVSMSAIELLARFRRHVLPDGFHKIRHFGIYSGAYSKNRDTKSNPVAAAFDYRAYLIQLTGRDITVCARCGCKLIFAPLPTARAPPKGVRR